ncbi:MAG: PAS domain-containing protein [Desulfomonilia bacterium]|jgi:transcriptional regulator with PAS, ATPase and Fis domain
MDEWPKTEKSFMKARQVDGSEGANPDQAENGAGYVEILEGMILHCAVALFAIDCNHRVIQWNTACEELTGIRSQEVLGTSEHWRAFYDHRRPCLSDLIIDGRRESLHDHYQVYGASILLPRGLHAEGWFERIGGRTRYLIFDASAVLGPSGAVKAAVETLQDITELKRVEEERERLNVELKAALDSIKTLKGLIPICAGCKKIRDDRGFWNHLEQYVEEHSDASFSHGLCPECFRKYFPET